MESLTKYLEENELEGLDSDELKQDFESLVKTGKNFLKIYSLLCPFVDLREYSEAYLKLWEKNKDLDGACCSTLSYREKEFERVVISNPSIIKLIREVLKFKKPKIDSLTQLLVKIDNGS